MDINVRLSLDSPEIASVLLALAEAIPQMNIAKFTPVKTEDKKVTLEEVRVKLAALSKSGKQKKVKALIEKYGVLKLTDIPEEKYGGLLKEAEAM